MKIDYDQETDAMTITFRDASIDESDEVAPGVIADFGEDGQIVRFEILGASSLIEAPDQVTISAPGKPQSESARAS